MSGVESLVAGLERSNDRFDTLAVEANLRITVDGRPLAVSGSGDRIRIGLPSLPGGLSLAAGRREAVRTLARTAAVAGLTIEVRVGDAVVALLGAEARPSLPARLLSLGPVQVRGRGLLAAALHIR